MRGNRNQLGGRSRWVSTLRPTGVVLLVLIAAVALPLGFVDEARGVASPRTSVSGPPPVVVYQGETIGVTGVGKTTGGTIGPGEKAFVGLAGNADGNVESGSASSLDFSDWATGSYDVDNDRKPELSVAEPKVTDVTLKLSNGADVTNRRAPADMPITLQTKFNFDKADGVELHITGPNGVDVARAVASSTRIDTSGGTVTLDFSDEDPGRYTVRVEARELEASRSVTIGIDTAATAITLDRTTAVKGERVRATVVGDAGETMMVRIRASALDGLGGTNDAAEQVFERSGNVQSRLGSSAQNVVYATVKLDDSGRGVAVIRTEHLRDQNTAEIQLARGTNPTSSTVDSVDLRVQERATTVRSSPEIVSVGEKFTMTGSAPQSDTVKAYARVDTRWEPLFESAANNRYAEARVKSDGTWELEIDTSRVLNIPGTYRIGVTADATKRHPSNRVLSSSEFSALTSASTSMRTTSGGLSVSPSSRSIAAGVGDEITLVGTAVGQGDRVHLYVVPPRGGGLAMAQTVTVRNGEFRQDVDVFSTRGTYQILVIGQGRDGSFKNGNTPPTVQQKLVKRTQDQNQIVAVLRNAYSGAGVDDQIVQLAITAANPALTIGDVGQNGQVLRERVTITGTSNRADRTSVSIEVINPSGQAVTSTETRVNGIDGTWTATVDLSDISTGSYTIRATDDEVTSEKSVQVVSQLGQTTTRTPTPTATPTERPSPTPTSTPTATAEPTSTPTAELTETAAPSPTRTRRGLAGFTIGIAAAALLISVLAMRRYGR